MSVDRYSTVYTADEDLQYAFVMANDAAPSARAAVRRLSRRVPLDWGGTLNETLVDLDQVRLVSMKDVNGDGYVCPDDDPAADRMKWWLVPIAAAYVAEGEAGPDA